MNSARFLSSLLLLAWLAVESALAVRLLVQPPVGLHPLAACSAGLVFGQVPLVCLWFVESRGNITLRLVGAAATLYLGGLIASAATDGVSHFNKWLAFLTLYALFLALALTVLQWSGCDVGSFGNPRCLSARSRRAWQCSLSALFGCTTGVALPLGLAQRWELPGKPFLAVCAFCFALTLASLVPLGIGARCRNVLLAVVVLLVFSPSIGLLLPLTGIPPGSHSTLSLMTSVQGASIAGSLVVLRIARAGPVM